MKLTQIQFARYAVLGLASSSICYLLNILLAQLDFEPDHYNKSDVWQMSIEISDKYASSAGAAFNWEFLL